MPLVSVLMPTYNTSAAHLREAIDSILNQSYTNFELLILDDASSQQDIKTVLQSYTDPRIKFFENKVNLGISQTRNKLISLAQGEYLAVHDHDDISDPNRLMVQVAFLEKHPDVGVVGAYYTIIPKKTLKLQPTSNEEIEKYFMYICHLPHPVAMIRKSVLHQYSVQYEEEYSPAEDYRMWCKLIGKTKFANIPQSLLLYRWHDKNTSIIEGAKMQSATQRIQKETRALHPETWEKAQKEIPIVEKKYKLFNKLTLLKTLYNGKVTKVYLFGRFLIATIIKKTHLSYPNKFDHPKIK